MSFDLKNVTKIFNKRMDNIFLELDYYCLIYTDDILVFSKTFKQHKDDMLVVTQRYIDHGIILEKNQ